MALATAATAAAVSLHPLLSRPACVLRFSRRLPPLLLRATSTSSTSSAPDFNITFAEPAPTKKASSPSPSAQPLVPWIVRGEDGKPRLSTTPPPEVLQAIALAEAEAKKAAKKESLKGQKGAVAAAAAVASSAGVKAKERNAGPAAPPKFSKAARRFYKREYQGERAAAARQGPCCCRRYICSCGEESKSVVSLFNDYLKGWNKTQPGLPKPRLFTVGRLDVATSGLIIVTNDGEFAQKLAHPSSNVTKEYVVTIDGAVHKKHLIAISEGTKIDGVMCVPDLVEPLAAQSDTRKTRLKIVVIFFACFILFYSSLLALLVHLSNVTVVYPQEYEKMVHEGRNHEVRELVQNAGLKVYALKRVRIGRIGKFVELKQADIKALEGNN
ncbi:hypothetical protein HU200_023887 [Digitaria exilis]|uniref:Pseudouridine synthase RsuA/RluA-like domain-containing protein n=1 Tax=Digitaria exilis TaxID=1010633 RepID=A0A835C3X4_9POAL|nr:hypothetical protein HU200_023887 [Digitaria exilis]